MPTLLIGLGAAMFLTGKGRVDAASGDAGGNGHGVGVLRHAADALRRRNGSGRTAQPRPTAPLATAPRLGDHRSLGDAPPHPGVSEMAARATRGVASTASNIAGGIGAAAQARPARWARPPRSVAGGHGVAADTVGSAVTGAAPSASAAASAIDAVGSAADAVGFGGGVGRGQRRIDCWTGRRRHALGCRSRRICRRRSGRHRA